MTAFDDDEAVAAEYALGTLDASERAEAERRRAVEPAFDTLIMAWEQRLGPLADVVSAVPPPPDLFARVMARLPQDGAARARSVVGDATIVMMRRQIRRWRNMAALTGTLAAMMALWIAGREVKLLAPQDQTYVAVLQRGPDQPSFVVSLDTANHKMVVMPMDASAPPGKSYELWMIGSAQAAPLSMGVIDTKAPLRPHLPNVDADTLSHATYAITVEPLGGSPDGKPSGAPVFSGRLTSMSL